MGGIYVIVYKTANITCMWFTKQITSDEPVLLLCLVRVF